MPVVDCQLGVHVEVQASRGRWCCVTTVFCDFTNIDQWHHGEHIDQFNRSGRRSYCLKAYSLCFERHNKFSASWWTDNRWSDGPMCRWTHAGC